MLSAKGDGMTHFGRSLEGAPDKRNRGRPPLPRLTPIEAAQLSPCEGTHFLRSGSGARLLPAPDR